MAKFAHIQNSFKSGLLSKKLEGRTDVEEYRNGCLQYENFITYPSGGAAKRPGTQYIGELDDLSTGDFTGTDKVGCYPFVVSKQVSYFIYLSTDNINTGTDVNIVILDADGAHVASLTDTGIDNTLVDATKFYTAQVGDVMFFCHLSGDVVPFVIKRTGASSFESSSFFAESQLNLRSSELSIPYRTLNLDVDKVLKYNTASGGTLTAEDSGGSAIDLFDADMVAGGLSTRFKFNDSGSTTIFRVSAFTSSSEVSVSILEGSTPSDGTTTDDWQESSWSAFRGFPRTIRAYRERLVFGGNVSEPDTLWNSATGNLYLLMQDKLLQDQAATDSSGLNYFGESVATTDPFSFNLGTSELNSIVWMSSIRNLHVGTLGGEFIVSSTDQGYVPGGAVVRPQTYYGGSPVQAERQGNLSLYISRDGKKLRDFSYSESNGSNVSRNISVLSEDAVFHNFSSGDYNSIEYKQIVFQKDKGVLWLLTTLGELVGITMSKDAETVSWHVHTIGGTDVNVKSIATLPSSDGSYDNLWMLVSRTIDGSTVNYVEIMGPNFEHPNLSNDSTNVSDRPFYSDCAIRVTDSPATDTFTGLDHLEGEEVQVLADGKIQAPVTVSGGSITLSDDFEEVIVGLKYTSNLETMPLEAGAVIGNSQILLKRVDQIIMKLYKSVGGQYYFESDSYDIEYGVDENETFSGISRVDYASTNSYRYTVKVKHEDPVPFNLLAMVFRGFTKD